MVRPRVDGTLNEVRFVEGQFIKQDELLAEIDPRPFQVQLEQAEAQMAKDQAALANGRADLARYQAAKEAISQQQLDTQLATVQQFEAATKIDQAQIDSAQLQITYCRITAPITGRVGLRLMDRGNMVHATDSTGIVVITQVQPITVVFAISEDDLLPVLKKTRDGASLRVEAYDRSFKNKLGEGELSAIDNQVDSTTGTVKLKATFPNGDLGLFPNQFVNARLEIDTLHDVVIVPSAAVQHGPDSLFVYVVGDQGAVEVRPVTLGPVQGDDTVIQSGISAGEMVVTDGVDKLEAGKKVTVRMSATRPAAAVSTSQSK
jgi:multidrug efflux system membrane fusion protein